MWTVIVRPFLLKMNPGYSFEFLGDYACFRPSGQVSFEQTIELVAKGITFANQNGVKRLLADTTQLTGFSSPSLIDRFRMAERWAAVNRGIRLAVMARPELIDPERFCVEVARNRGLLIEVFTSETEAISWLLQVPSK